MPLTEVPVVTQEQFKSNVTLSTKISPDQIKCKDQLSAKDDYTTFKYYCPVCLRHFTHTLESKCCHNYICHLCAYDLLDREALTQKKAGCVFGCSFQDETVKMLQLGDVDLNEAPKRYTDS